MFKSNLTYLYHKKGILKIIVSFFLKEKIAMLYLLFCIFIGGITTSVDSLLIKYIIDFIENTTKVTFESYTFFEFLKWPLIFFVWWEILNITWRIYDYIYLKYIPKIKKNVVDSFFLEIQTYQYEYFKKSDPSMIAPRIMDAARSIEMVYAIFIENILRKVIGIFSAFILLYSLHYTLFLVFAVWVFVFIIVSFLCINRITKYSRNYSETRAKSNSVIANSILNIFNIKIFNGTKKEISYLSNVTNDMQEKETIMQVFMLKLRYFLGSSSSIMVLCMVYFGISLKANEILTVGDIALLINICIAVGDDIWELMQEMGDLMEEYGAFVQSCDIFKNILLVYENNVAQDNIENIKTKNEILNKIFFDISNESIFNKINNKIIDTQNTSNINHDSIDNHIININKSIDTSKSIYASKSLDLIRNTDAKNNTKQTQEKSNTMMHNEILKQQINNSDTSDLKKLNELNDANTITGIELRDVYFQYSDNLQIFNKKSISIKAGEKIALVGPSGSGKSTFTHIIARIYDIQSGDILINNQSIYSITKEELAKKISFIAQEPILFERSIFENISYGVENATLESVINAAKLAYIHDKIMKLKHGYESLYGSKDCNLSVGEKQRIIIARAILKDSPILVLDEATSALDNITEQLVYKSFEQLMQNKTVITIAHRLQTTLNMNRILLFNNGQIVEDGTHEELLAKKELYYKLWNAQFKHKDNN